MSGTRYLMVIFWLAFSLAIFFGWSLLAHNGSATQVSKGEFPVCAKTGHSLGAQEVVDIAVKEQMRIMRAMNLCSVRYNSLAEFYRTNPKCCEIDREHLFYGQPLVDRDLGESGQLIGNVKASYYCGSNDRRVGHQGGGGAGSAAGGRRTGAT